MAVIAAGGWGVANSPLFRARTIEVSGASHLDRAQVLREAGLAPGMNVLWLDTAAAIHRLEANRWIASATVARSLPSTVRVSVTERTPAAEVKVGSRWALVAADGMVLERVSDDPRLPLLMTALGDRRVLAGPASVVGRMSPWVRARVHSVVPSRDGSLVVELSSGIHVLFGNASDIAVKDQALAGILRWVSSSGTKVGYVDLRAPLAPAVGSGDAPPASPRAGASPSPTPAADTGA
ncbi:MAG: FtsQ-type POTRA domain-containing protein [Actinomycetota bacterium]|nr:FtsQ-type POTRA domain-containing protein [Actinomycetota bacterium]